MHPMRQVPTYLAKQNMRNQKPTLPANAARHVATRIIICSFVSLSEILPSYKPPLRYTRISLPKRVPVTSNHTNSVITSSYTIIAIMRVSAFAFAAVLSLVSAKNINMRCEFAADKTGMVQQPFCCRDLTVARGNSKVNEAMDCKNNVPGIFDHQ